MPNKDNFEDIINEAEANGLLVESISMADLSFKDGMDQVLTIVNKYDEPMFMPASDKKEFCVVLPMSVVEEKERKEILAELFD